MKKLSNGKQIFALNNIKDYTEIESASNFSPDLIVGFYVSITATSCQAENEAVLINQIPKGALMRTMNCLLKLLMFQSDIFLVNDLLES
ncbi:CLUMA_CG002277, isoform A [Clunio marinus]|uniref:CLUMA_CG002277, isoform A n=1 Tax=Clunio marinus TaxID=568069 RepID=A0A1J1HKP4_9DIPT|nr:CLUMA_CG002277, isoform A [Clunio marinus]